MSSLGPRAVICYVCGRKYGTASIKIHEPQCLQKWHLENTELPPHMRRRPPVRPEGFGEFRKNGQSLGNQIDAMNELSYESSKQQLLPCENCGRTFLPDRLPVHQRSCRPGNVAKRSNAVKYANEGFGNSNRFASPRPREVREPVKPKTCVCYICGREFGTASISIHEPQCLKKWKLENNSLPKSMRKPLPVKPDLLPSLTGNDNEDRERMNVLAYESAKQQLVPCPNCGRTFKPDRLNIHLRSCKENVVKTFSSPRDGVNGVSNDAESMSFHQVRSPSYPPKNPRINSGRKTNRKLSKPQQDMNNNLRNKENSPHGPNVLENGSKFRLGKSNHEDISSRKISNLYKNKSNSHGSDSNSPKMYSNFHESNGYNSRKKITTSRNGYNSQWDKYNSDVDMTTVSATSSRSRAKGVHRTTVTQRNTNRKFSQKSGSKGEGNGVVSMDYEAFEPSSGDGNLVPCYKCGRTFAADRVEKHQKICSNTKQRKVFDSSKHRTQGTEAAVYNRSSRSLRAKQDIPKPKSNWKKNHEDFVRAIRDAKKAQDYVKKGGNLADLPPPPPSENPDYVYCKHCTRRFAPETAARHIPKCAMTLNRPAPPKQRAIPLGGKTPAGRTRGGLANRQMLTSRRHHR